MLRAALLQREDATRHYADAAETVLMRCRRRRHLCRRTRFCSPIYFDDALYAFHAYAVIAEHL